MSETNEEMARRLKEPQRLAGEPTPLSHEFVGALFGSNLCVRCGLGEAENTRHYPAPVSEPESALTQEGAERIAAVVLLENWWRETAAADFDAMEPKITEYTGGTDLELMGSFMESWLGLPAGSGPEAACLWYALGKVARAVAAYREGRLPSEDTLHDLSVYSMMARRIRQTGRWP